MSTDAPASSNPATPIPAGLSTMAQPATAERNPSSETIGPPAAVPFQTVGRYEIRGELGRGGWGIVYHAYDTELKRPIALKMLSAGVGASVDELIRFRGEAELVARLQHPNIVQIYEIGQHDEGQPFLALEYVDGGSLDRRTKGQPQPARTAAETVEVLARAIHAAHQQGVIHRDLKPANVLLQRRSDVLPAPAAFRLSDFVPKLCDFGLAKRVEGSSSLTRTGDVLGTPSYMAPEQAAGSKDVGPPVDVYALGAILYEMLTGRPPFAGESVWDTLQQVLHDDPAPPSRLVPRLHRDLSTICLKCLHKSPARRYASAEALADDLRRWLDGDPIQARPVGRGERFWRSVRRHPLVTVLAVSTSVTAVALVYGLFAAHERAHQKAVNDQELGHQKAVSEEAEAHRKELQEQYNRSLAALDGVLALIMQEDGNGLGRQRGLEPLHQELLKYYDGMVKRQEGALGSARQELAGACAKLGQLMKKTGNRDQAVAAYQKAADLYEAVIADKGAAADVRFELADARLEIGQQYRDLAKLQQAEDAYRKAREGFDRLCRESPNEPKYSRRLAEVWHNLGILYNDRGAQIKSLEAYRTALALRQKLFDGDRSNVDYMRDVARSHGYIGDVELDLGDYARADASYWESHKLREKLVQLNQKMTQANDREARFQLGRSFGNFGNYQTRMRAYATAADYYGRALAEQKKLYDDDPAYAEYQRDLASTYCRLAELGLLLPRSAAEAPPKEVFDALDESIKLYQQLKTEDSVVRSGLAEALLIQARAILTQTTVDDVDRAKAQASVNTARGLLREQQRDATDRFFLAAALALNAELSGGPLAPDAGAIKELKTAIDSGYRQKHPDDLKRDRAFRSLANTEAFGEILKDYRRKLDGVTAGG
jgi:serine/threonine-protein kinase